MMHQRVNSIKVTKSDHSSGYRSYQPLTKDGSFMKAGESGNNQVFSKQHKKEQDQIGLVPDDIEFELDENISDSNSNV